MYPRARSSSRCAARRTPSCVKTKKEVALLTSSTACTWTCSTPWRLPRRPLDRRRRRRSRTWRSAIDGYDARCKKMPKRLRGSTKAYQDLREQLTDFQDMLPLFSGAHQAVDQDAPLGRGDRGDEDRSSRTTRREFKLQDVMYSTHPRVQGGHRGDLRGRGQAARHRDASSARSRTSGRSKAFSSSPGRAATCPMLRPSAR